MIMKKYLLALAVFFMITSNVMAQETMKVEIKNGMLKAVNGVVYKSIYTGKTSRQLTMNILEPDNNELKPVVVFYPGGGFMTANNDRFVEMRTALAKVGFVVVSAEYRTLPDMYPALVEDAKQAVRYVKAHAAELGADSTRVGVLGNSAGGYVAQMMGTTNGESMYDVGDFLNVSSDVKAVCTIFGISNLLNIGEGYNEDILKVHASPSSTESLLIYGPSFAGSIGKSILSDSVKALKASPIGHIKENMPPFLIMHGSADKLVSPKQSEHLYNALIAKQNKVDYVIVDGAGHGDLYWYQQPVIDKVVNWFKKNL